MSASWWVKFILMLVQASWWEGLVLAHRWVELGLVPLVGRAISVGVFIGDCCLWLTRQPVCWWVGLCPTFLVGCPEVSQQWSLGLAAEMVISGWVHTGEYSLGHLQSVFLPPSWVIANPCSPGDLLRLAGRSGQGFCGVGALPWVPVRVKTCVCAPSVEPVFLPVLWSSCTDTPLACKARFCGDSSWCQTPQGGELDVGLRTLTPMREPLGCNYFPSCELPTQEVGILPVLQKCPSYHLIVFGYRISFLLCSIIFCQWLFTS